MCQAKLSGIKNQSGRIARLVFKIKIIHGYQQTKGWKSKKLLPGFFTAFARLHFIVMSTNVVWSLESCDWSSLSLARIFHVCGQYFLLNIIYSITY